MERNDETHHDDKQSAADGSNVAQNSDEPQSSNNPGKTASHPLKIDATEDQARSHIGIIANPDSSPSASPPRKKLISDLKEKMINAERAQNMKLAHEIAVDKNFKLPDHSQEPSPDDKSAKANLQRFEKNIKDVVHRAFWDILRSGIESNPPNYDHAFMLLQEIKETLLSLLPPSRTTSIHRSIEEHMDMDLLRQQANNEALDVKIIGAFIIDTMASMCAPVRDDQISALRSAVDIVDLFKGIYGVLDLMKIDHANFAIQTVRPYLQQRDFEFERTQFAKLYKNVSDLKRTRKWIWRAYEKIQEDLEQMYQEQRKSHSSSATATDRSAGKSYSAMKKSKLSPFSILRESYTQILHEDLHLNQLPETLEMDQARIHELRQKVTKIVLVSAVMLTSCGVFGQPLASHKEFLVKLKDDIITVSAPEESKDTCDMLERITLQCWKDAVEYCQGKAPDVSKCVRASNEQVLRTQITALKEKLNHPVYRLLYNRTVQYLQMSMDILSQHRSTTPPTLPHPPIGLSFLTDELITIAIQYAKLVNMNRTIYGPFYAPILQDVLATVDSNSTNIATPTEVQNDSAPVKSAAKKLDFVTPKAEEDLTDRTEKATGKYKVTGSLEDLD